MAIHVLHGEPDPVLYAEGRRLTSQRKLHMGAGLDSTQVYSSGVFGVVENTLPRGEQSIREGQESKELQS